MILLAGMLFGASAAAQERVVTPAIDSVAMFKNGLTVVHSSFDAPQAGDYVWADPPAAVHGAFFVESEPGLVIRSTTKMMKPAGPNIPSGDLQSDLAGAVVSVTLLSGEGIGEEVKGTVWSVPVPDRAAWNRLYATTEGARSHHWTYYNPAPSPSRGATMMTGGWLVVETEAGRRFLSVSRIGQVRILREAEERAEVPQPVMVFSAKKAGKVRLTYLTKGMAWMPAYQIDLLAGDRLRLRQSAVVRNELMNLKAARLDLISGYPNIKFAHVSSPLSAGSTLAAFFQQISQEGGNQGGIATQQIAFNPTSNFAMPAAPAANPDPGAPAEDLHYESIGKQDLLEGDSLSLEVATAEATCERIVEWNVPDFRNYDGRMRRGQQPGADDEPWDAVQFSNPLKFPMTTAAASVLEDGKFRGQSMATWTAPGQRASIKINKALTVRGEHSEIEEEGKRTTVWIAGEDYQRTNVKGTLKVSNARAEAVKMVVRLKLSGDLIEAQGDPAKTLLTDGVRSVNPRRQLEWSIDLAAGKTQEMTYRYSVLVNR